MACFIFSSVLLSSADSARAQVVCAAGAGSATSPFSTACGDGAEAAGNIGNTSIGANAGQNATGDFNQFFGLGAGLAASGSQNTATGNGAAANSTGSNNTANGYQAGSGTVGDNNVAIGVEAGKDTNGNNNVAIGNLATTVGGSNATAVGANSVANHEGSTALGSGAETTAANQIMFGTGINTYVMPGLPNSAASAGDKIVTVNPATGQLTSSSVSVTSSGGLDFGGGGLTTTGAISTASLAVGTGGVSVTAGAPVNMGGNRVQNVAAPVLASDAANKGYVDNGLAAANARIDKAFEDIDDNTEGIAVAIAMGGLVLPQGKNFAIAGNAGFYDDKQALAANAAIRVDEVMTLNAGIGVGLDNNKVGGRVGFMAAW